MPGAMHTQSSRTLRNQRRAGSGGGRGGGKGATVMRDRGLGDLRGKDGVIDRRGGRPCEESKAKDKNGHQRPREENGLKGRAADGRGKGGTKGGNRGSALKSNKTVSNKEVYLPAMVVPRTPIVQRNLETTHQGIEPRFTPIFFNNHFLFGSFSKQDHGFVCETHYALCRLLFLLIFTLILFYY